MTKFLTDLITDKTPILKLEPNYDITRKEKLAVLGLDSKSSFLYTDYMYFFNNTWYYFKRDGMNNNYAFYILDELMGTYLAKNRELPTVTYEIAKTNDSYGIASINFKNKKFNYYTLKQLIGNTSLCTGIQNIELLKQFCNNTVNETKLLEHIFNMLALDIHMLQRDRCNVNLQFQMDKENHYFDIAPLYDYSICELKVSDIGINMKTPIILINNASISLLLKKYPVFKRALEMCLNQSMKELWDKICLDYHFNQECSSYERIKDYYDIKDKSQKQYIKKILKDVR